MSLKKSRFIKGIILAPDSVPLDGAEGEIKVDSSTGKIQVTLRDGVNPPDSREIVTSSQTQILTNKTLTSPVLDTGVSGSAIDIDGTLAANSDTKLASQKAVKTYVDAQIGSKDEADEIIYDNTTSGLVATNVQTAIDEVDGNVDNLVTLSGVALDSTTLGTFTGTTIPDSSTIKSAIQSLETSHESHTGASANVHGLSGGAVVVGDISSQALTNKTIDADLNTITNIEDADIKVGAAIARAKLASGTANRVVINDATGVQTDAAAITASRALVSDANGIPTHSSTTSTEIDHLSGVTSAIQTQLDGKVDESGGTLTSGSVITPARLDVKQGTKAELVSYAALPTTTNGQIVYAIDTKEMFQVIDGLLEGIGGGEGVGGTDILFAQTFETAALTDFTQTGLSLSTSSPLHGEISALLTHQAGVSPTNDQSFKQVIPVDNKFRNQTMVLRLDVKSNASAGNVVIKIYDETNAANIVASEQLQLSNDVNGTKNSVGFTIPETCASLSYTITALPEAGSPVTRIDDIICELAETALLETAVEVPVVTSWQGYTPTFQGFGSPSAIEFEWRQVGENVEIRGKFTGGAPTADEARVTLPAGLTSAGTNLIPSIQIIGSAIVNNTGSISVFQTLVEPSVNYVSFGFRDATRTPLTKLAGNIISANGLAFNFTASIPCSGLSATTTKTIPLTQSGLVQEGDGHYQLNNFTYRTASTAADILYFNDGSLVANLGDHVTKLSDSVNGDQFVATKSGIYNVTFSAEFGTTVGNCYLTKNSTTASASTVLASIYENGSNFLNNLAWSGYLQEGDTLRFVRSGFGSTFTAAISNYLSISYQGSLKQIAVSSDQKLRIPTSELRFEGASARGTGTETGIVQFSSLTKLRGDAFTINNSNGTAITMTKAGMLSISANVYVAPTVYTYITKNQAVRTASPVPVASEILSSNGGGSNPVSNPCWTGFVNIGDIIRIYATANPVVDPSNNLNLAFQEQDISVSVTNTLPQFSESDSCVQLTGANGFGSTATTTRRFASVVQNVGTDVEYIDSPTLGGQFVAKSAGIYHISYSERSGANDDDCSASIFVNGSAFSSALDRINTVSTLLKGPSTSWSGYLNTGDIVTGVTSGNGETTLFTISKVGKPNVTGVDVTPFVNVPQPDFAHARLSGRNTVSSGNMVFDTVDELFGNNILNVDTTLTYHRVTILKDCYIDINYGTGAVSLVNNAYPIYLYKNGISIASSQPGDAGTGNIPAPFVAFSGKARIGDVFTFGAPASAPSYGDSTVYANLKATALSDQILTAPETFSTDTASLTYAGSGTYTPSTLANAPVGTYITFTYAGGGNARSQTTGLNRPTQTDADMNANGILLYTRVFSVGSSSSQPAAIAIQIGKGMKGKTIDLYKSAGKLISGSIDSIHVGTDTQRGLAFQSYDEKTGILYLDAGLNLNGVATTDNKFIFNDNLTQASGYLVINASKNPSVFGLGLQTVAARAVQSSGQSIANAGNIVMLYDSAKTYDTNGALNTATGVFTAPESGYYQASWGCLFTGMTSNLGQVITTTLFKNGVAFSEGAYNTMDRAVAIDAGSNGSCGVYLAKGDTVDIRIFNNRAGGATSLITSARYNFFSIHKTSLSTGN